MYGAYMRDASKKPTARRRSGDPKASEDDARDSEAAFLATYDLSAFPRPSVAVDVVVLTTTGGVVRAVVYERREHPSRGHYALPGGFVGLDESLDHAAARLLRDKAGLTKVFIEQLYTFGAPRRDPRGRIITVAYYALVGPQRFDEVVAKQAESGNGARVVTVLVPWSGETGGPVDIVGDAGDRLPLAFDHADILGLAIKRIRGKLDYTAIGFQLLPEEFTLRDLQDVHEAVRGEVVNKDSFRRRMLAAGVLEATGERERDTAHRPAELYRFTKRSSV